MPRSRVLSELLVVLSLSVAGCGDSQKLAPVTGVVTFDGAPLSGAWVIYEPEHGRISTGRTDTDGRYELFFTPDRTGALIGPHCVRIHSVEPGVAAAGSHGERIPARFNSRTTLELEVIDARNEVDFDLTTD
jgi:hypothetical protein